MKRLFIAHDTESAVKSKASLRYIASNADQLEVMGFHSLDGPISERFHCKSKDQSGRDEEKKAWIKAIMDRNVFVGNEI